MEKVKDTEIVIRETYGDECLVDQVNVNKPSCRRPQGEVHIYEARDDGDKKLVHKSNLVVYLGREMLAQRLVDTDNPLVTPTKDEWVQWFGVGDGGVTPADPLDPTPPINDDEDLYSPVMIASDSTALYADWHTDIAKVGYYKKIFDPSTTEFETDYLNSDKYLVIKLTTTIGVNDANGEQLSEAGLFSAASRTGGYDGQFSLFARVTFPSLIKTVERRLIFVWYLYV